MGKKALYRDLREMKLIVPLLQEEFYDLDLKDGSMRAGCPLTQLAVSKAIVNIRELSVADNIGKDGSKHILTRLKKFYGVKKRVLERFYEEWDMLELPKKKLNRKRIAELVDELEQE